MCRKGQSPMPERYLREMARLLQTYKDLHPYRIARRYGVTETFVRELGSKYQPEDLSPLCEALATIYGFAGIHASANGARCRVAGEHPIDEPTPCRPTGFA